MKNREEALAIFNKFNIQAEEVEPTVYRVINDTQEINIDALELELKECFLLISPQTRYEKDAEGYGIEHGLIYYILLDCSNGSLMRKYNKISKEERETLITSFKYDPHYEETIDTIYSAEELGLTKA